MKHKNIRDAYRIAALVVEDARQLDLANNQTDRDEISKKLREIAGDLYLKSFK